MVTAALDPGVVRNTLPLKGEVATAIPVGRREKERVAQPDNGIIRGTSIQSNVDHHGLRLVVDIGDLLDDEPELI